MATDIADAYSRARKVKEQIESMLEESAQSKTALSTVAAQQRLSALSAEFSGSVAEVGRLASQVSDNSKTMWKRRASNLDDDASNIQCTVDKQLGKFYKQRKDDEDRKALFGDRAPKQEGDETSSLLKERRGLSEANSMLDEILEQGQSTLDNLINQNKVLKTAKRKLLDIANVMGVSASLVNVIDRRQTGDKWLVYGGMVLTLFLLFSLWYLLRW